jgi:ribosomal protein L40E
LLVVAAVSLVYAEKICPNCGASNSDNAKFCKVCGAKLPEATSRPQEPKVAGSVSVQGGTVSIKSDPSGAAVVVDGKSRGRTPVELNDFGPGRHNVEISRSGYRTYYADFNITAVFGSMVITTDPVGADVFLDGEDHGPAGEGGLALSHVVYGSHTITAKLDGYRDLTKTVELSSPGPVAVVLTLISSKGFLRVESKPTGGTLLMNSKPVGRTPYAAELLPARYMLTVTHRGFYDWVGYADVQFAESVHVKAVLDKMQTHKWPFLVAAVAGLGYGGYSASQGESQYSKYRTAGTQEDAKKYHLSTQSWDTKRDIGVGVGALMALLFALVKW